MTTAYFDCFSGVSGDMTLAALVDAGLSVAKLRRELSTLEVEGYTLSAKKVKRCGVAGTKVTVRLKKTARVASRRYPDIVRLIKRSGLATEAKRKALAVFETLAEAEAEVHDVPMNRVHFHEVGAVDSIVDIVGAAIGLTALGVDRIEASPINTGSGTVKTEHGVLPVPAPATAVLLKGVPSYAAGPAVELTTPTGASILKTLASRFGPQPMMTARAIGNGAGGHDFPGRPNILRLFIGEGNDDLLAETLAELETNIDDMNPQAYGPVRDLLFSAGALDVWMTPIQMKKGRPGVALSVLCRPDVSATLESIIFAHTTTLGVRRRMVERVSLPREIKKVRTRYGAIEIKVARLPGGKMKTAPEFESVKKAAEKHNVPFDTVYHAALAAPLSEQ